MFNENSIPKTRITIPRRRTEILSRPRLLDLLDHLMEKKLILVTAPPGYGKTSLLVDYANQSILPVCWYSINSLDLELSRFISNLVAAIRIRFPAFGQRTQAVLQNATGHLDIDLTATIMINDLYDNVTEHFGVVLDDYHLVNDHAQIRHFVNRLIQDVDESCHIVITSRTLLSLPALTLMAARGEIGGISYEELAFQTDEIRQFYLQNRGDSFTIETAAQIHERTEGWITGILLSTQNSLSTSGRYPRFMRIHGFGLDEYFHELLNNQSNEIRAFLLRTSLLEEFNAEWIEQVLSDCLSLTGINWQALMDTVQRENLFVLPVGEDGSWLRYHNLFLEFLQGQMEREQPNETQKILLGLEKVHTKKREWDSSFTILRKLNLFDEMANLVEVAGPEMLVDGRISTLSSWLDTLPVEILNTRPAIISLQGAVAATTGDASLALTLYNQAIAAMKLPDDRQNISRALVWRAGTLRFMGNLSASISDSRETLSLIENDLEMRKIKAEAYRCIGMCLRTQGKLSEARDWLDRALTTSISIRDKNNEAIIRLELGMLYEYMGKYDPAEAMYRTALEHWQQVDNALWLSNLHNNLGVLQQLKGNYQTAIESLEKALNYARSSGYSRLTAYILTGIADIYAELEAFDESMRTYQQARATAQRIGENFLLVYLNLQEAALASANGDYTIAQKLIEDARSIAHLDSSDMEIQLCELEWGGLNLRQKKAQDAISILEKCRVFFEREGHKVQTEKSNLYLMLAYSQIDYQTKLIELVLKVLAYLEAEYPPASLIAHASRFYAQLLDLRNLDYIGNQIDGFLNKIEAFRDQLPVLRRYLRQHAVTIPFAPPKINIRSLGKMQVKLDNRVITSSDWQTQISRDLFYLLMARPEGTSKDEIGLIFWPDSDPEDVRFRIKNTVYRVRHAVGKDAIILDQDHYRFNNRLDYEYDVEHLLRENALAQQAKDALQKLSHFREAIKLYRGEYLPEINETWVLSPRESLRQIFLNNLLQVSEIYLNLSNYDLALEYCQRAIEEDDCLEVAYRLSLRIYAAMGNRAAIVRQYQRCRETLQREINIEPSPQTQALYQELIK